MEGDRWVGPLIDSVGGGRGVGTASEALYHEAIIPLWSDGGAALHALSRSGRLAEEPLTLFLQAVCDELRTVVGDEFPEIRSLGELRGMLMFWIWDAVTRPPKAFDSRPEYRATLLATWARVAGDEVTREIEAELSAALDRWTTFATAV